MGLLAVMGTRSMAVPGGRPEEVARGLSPPPRVLAVDVRATLPGGPWSGVSSWHVRCEIWIYFQS